MMSLSDAAIAADARLVGADARLCGVSTDSRSLSKEDLFVAEGLRHFQRADVGERDSYVFRLAAGISAVHVRIAEQARRRVTVQLFGHPGVRVRVIAQRP